MINAWKGKKVLILGLGQYEKGSGIAAALYFAKAKADLVVYDFYYTPAMDKNIAALKKFSNVRFVLKQHALDEIRRAELIVKHQRVRLSEPEVVEAVRRNIPIESAESIFLRNCPCPVIGITGTRGKSTTTTLVHEMLQASFPKKQVWIGGNILISPLTYLSRVKSDDLVVLELSSFQLEGTGAAGISPHIACVTNLMRDHLNTYSGMDEYAEAKAQIFRHQSPDDVVVLNADDAYGKEFATEAPGQVRVFGKKPSKRTDAWMTEGALVLHGETLIDKAALRVTGDHLYANMLAAVLIAEAAGAKVPAMKRVLKSFRGIPDRQELLGTIRGVTFINDTTATTPDGAIAALKRFRSSGKTLRLVLGGADKELEFSALAKELKRTRVDIAMLPGTAYEKLTAALIAARIRYADVSTLQEAVHYLHERAEKGDILLLSPGCASFGLFQNEFDRGEQFRKLFASLQRRV